MQFVQSTAQDRSVAGHARWQICTRMVNADLVFVKKDRREFSKECGKERDCDPVTWLKLSRRASSGDDDTVTVQKRSVG